MSISLYDATVLGFIQITSAVEKFMQRSLAHCSSIGKDIEPLVEARLIGDMLPLRFQILSVIHHSLGAIEGVQRGTFSPPPASPPLGYAALQEAIAGANARLKAFTREEIDVLQGREVVFDAPQLNLRLLFVAEDFLLSFSTPNVHFHAATAYDILRANGIPLGKADYMGKLRIKR